MLSFIKKLFHSKDKKGYYFIHIPKTAGTSFINTLDTCVAEKEIFPCQLWHEVNKDIVTEKSKYKLLRGHFGGGAYKLLTDGNPHLLTILRHPESLSISTYHFIKREKNTAVHDLVTSRNMSLLEFLQEPLTAQKINNRMVRHLSFDLQSDPEAQELFLSKQSVEVVSNWIKTPKKITNQQRLVRAKEILNECSWFGIQEQFDKSMQLFAYIFNLPPIGKSAKLNSHNPQQLIDNKCASLIAEQNTYDLELYSYALAKFEERYHNMCKALGCNEKDVDRLIEKKYESSQSETQSKELIYNFEKRLIGSGWHRREIALPEESTFRWTSNNKAIIYLAIEKQSYDLEIRIINAASKEHLDGLQLLVNNQKISYQYDHKYGVVRLLSAQIPKDLISGKPLKIQFNHIDTLKHRDCFDSDDNRSLGIAVNWIKIAPCMKKQVRKKI